MSSGPEWVSECQGCGAPCGEFWHLPISNLLVCRRCYGWYLNDVEDRRKEEQYGRDYRGTPEGGEVG